MSDRTRVPTSRQECEWLAEQIEDEDQLSDLQVAAFVALYHLSDPRTVAERMMDGYPEKPVIRNDETGRNSKKSRFNYMAGALKAHASIKKSDEHATPRVRYAAEDGYCTFPEEHVYYDVKPVDEGKPEAKETPEK